LTRISFWTAVLACVAATLVFAPSATAAPARTTVSISPQQGGFSGFVRSSKRACANGRKVYLYRRSGRRSIFVKSDPATANGDRFQWAIQVSRGGRYYARVKGSRQCGAASSRTVSPQ
jgi:hypothetical protein